MTITYETIGPAIDEATEAQLKRFLGKGVVNAYIEFMKIHNGALLTGAILTIAINESDRQARIQSLEYALSSMQDIKPFSQMIWSIQKQNITELLERAKAESSTEYEIVKMLPFSDQIDGLVNVNTEWKEWLSLAGARKPVIIGEEMTGAMLCLNKRDGMLFLMDPDVVGNGDEGLIDLGISMRHFT